MKGKSLTKFLDFRRLKLWLLSCNLFLAVWFPRDNYSCITVCALAYIHEDISDRIDFIGKLCYRSLKKNNAVVVVVACLI